MVDVSVSYPADDTICLQSGFLFSDSKSQPCQEFLKRVFRAKQVVSVSVRPVRRMAEIRYSTDTSTRQDALRAIYQCLTKEGAKGGVSGANAHAEQESVPAHHGHPEAGATVDPSRSWQPNDKGEVQLFRHGNLISDWQVRHEIPGRIRLRHDALHRRAEVCQSVERELMSVLGVDNYKTNALTSSVLVNYNERQITRDQILEILDGVINRLTYPETKDRPTLDFALCTVGIPLAAVAQFAAPALLPVAAGLFVYNSVHTFKEAYHVLFKEKRLGVDVLDAIVVVSCLGTGQVFAGSVLCWCLSFGRMLVKLTQDNSKKMLMNVFGKQPRFVWLVKNGVETEVSLEKVGQGDIIVVNTGEAVPVDGIVKEGMAMIDQHALTGESTPAEKVVGDHVFASTMVVAGKVFIEVQQAGTETTSAKIAAILNDTAGYKLDSQNKGEALADKAVVPTLALGALGLAVMGPAGATAVLNSDFGTGIRMAAPLAMLSSLTLCAQHGILVKDGRAMDLMNEVDTVLFDKTGTLTREVPEVGRVITCSKYSGDEILTWAAAAENRFAHPIAKAILEKFYSLGKPMPRTDDSQYKVGFGLTVGIDGKTIRVGSARFMKMEGIAIPSEVQQALDAAHDEGFSLVMVGVNDELGGAIELRASHRPEAQDIISGLRARGISHLAIISGDHEGPTKKLADSLGMDEYFAGVLPGDKANYVEKLQKQGRKVCFVGDGINDSIALKKANVSVSLRGATSIATDTAQVVFMEESLAKLCDFLDISRNLDRNVKRSWSLIIAPNALCIAGAFTLGFGVMASVLTNNVAAIAALANGLLPLRDVAKLQVRQEREREMRIATGGH